MIAFDGEYLVGAHHIPRGVDVVAGEPPEEVGIAHRGEDVVRLHPVVAVVGAELQKLGQILVPCVEIDRNGALTHAELIHRDGGVVDEFDPTDDSARRALEAAYGRARRAYFAEIETHAAPELAHFGEVVDAAVDAVERIGHGVDETARELMIGLAGVGKRWGRHRHFQKGKHVVERLHPAHPVLLIHRKVHSDAEEHLLRSLEQRAVEVVDDIAFEHELQGGIGEKFVTLRVDETGAGVHFLLCIVFEDIFAVKTAVGKIAQL